MKYFQKIYIYETNDTEEKLSDFTDQKIKLMFLAAGLLKLLQKFDFELFQKMKFQVLNEHSFPLISCILQTEIILTTAGKILTTPMIQQNTSTKQIALILTIS